MFSLFARLRKKFMSQPQRKKIRSRPLHGPLQVEDLEGRILLDAYIAVQSGPWNNVNTWLDVSGPGTVPGAGDTATIGGAFAVTIPAQYNASIISLSVLGSLGIANQGTLDAGGTVGVAGSLDDAGNVTAGNLTSSTGTVTIESGALATVDAAALSGALTTIAGRLSANGGATVDLNGTTKIGAGDLNGNLAGAAGSTFNLNGNIEFLAGATLGAGLYNVNVNAPVKVDGSLLDPTVLNLTSGGNADGAITGGGSLDVTNALGWTGGTLGVPTTIESSGNLNTSGTDGETLSSTLTNESSFCTLGGSAGFTIANGGKFDNLTGQTILSLPFITTSSGGTGAFVNEATATLDVETTGSALITGDFTNAGTLKVGSGAGLTLSTSGGGTDDLSGTLQLGGNLTLLGTIGSTTGLIVNAGSGTLKVGSGSGSGTSGTLAVAGSYGINLFGNMEVTSTGAFTMGGQFFDSGHLTLDYGAKTALNSYKQSSTGTLEIQVYGPGVSSAPTITGAAQLSGTLLVDYVGYPVNSGQSFPVLSAGSVGDHFDTTPSDLTITYGASGVTATKK